MSFWWLDNFLLPFLPKGGRQIDGVVEYDFAGILMMLIIAIYLAKQMAEEWGGRLSCLLQ